MTAAVISFPLSRVAGWCRHSCLLWLACLFTVHLSDCPPPSLGLRVPCPLCYMSFFFQLLIIIQFVFFSLFFLSGWGSVCPGGYADLAQDCL
jgi:hypothetical protein